MECEIIGKFPPNKLFPDLHFKRIAEAAVSKIGQGQNQGQQVGSCVSRYKVRIVLMAALELRTGRITKIESSEYGDG